MRVESISTGCDRYGWRVELEGEISESDWAQLHDLVGQEVLIVRADAPKRTLVGAVRGWLKS